MVTHQAPGSVMQTAHPLTFAWVTLIGKGLSTPHPHTTAPVPRCWERWGGVGAGWEGEGMREESSRGKLSQGTKRRREKSYGKWEGGGPVLDPWFTLDPVASCLKEWFQVLERSP